MEFAFPIAMLLAGFAGYKLGFSKGKKEFEPKPEPRPSAPAPDFDPNDLR